MRFLFLPLFFMLNTIGLKAQVEVHQLLDTINHEYIIHHVAHFQNSGGLPAVFSEPEIVNNEGIIKAYYNRIGPSQSFPQTNSDTIYTGIPFGFANMTLITQCNTIGPSITDTNFNTAIDTLFLNSLSIEEENIASVSINNPISTHIEISITQNISKPKEIEIWNGLGQFIHRLPFQESIDVQFLSKGFYFLKIKNKAYKFYKL